MLFCLLKRPLHLVILPLLAPIGIVSPFVTVNVDFFFFPLRASVFQSFNPFLFRGWCPFVQCCSFFFFLRLSATPLLNLLLCVGLASLPIKFNDVFFFFSSCLEEELRLSLRQSRAGIFFHAFL